MRSRTLFSWSTRVAAVAALCAAPQLAMADAYQQVCDLGGDQLGSSIATNGDFTGDGVNDIAIGSPCMFVRGHYHAGRVIVIDGKDGHKVFKKKGAAENQWLGAAVSFIHDLNGDGRDELAIGSPGYDVTIANQQGAPDAKLLDRAGRVDIYSKHKRRMRIFGTHIRASLGEKIAPLNDINDDGWDDFVVSASGDRNANELAQPGRVYTISGKNGDVLGYRIGPKGGNSYGRSLASATDLDGDGLFDFLAGSDEANVPGVLRSGVVDALSSADPASEPIFEVSGAAHDRIGKTVDFAGDVNDDDVPDLITGSDASDDTGVKLSGLVSLFSIDGTRLWVVHDTKMQEGARFGSSVARIGDINGDLVPDFAATAPRQDYFIEKRFVPDAGRLVTLSGVDGSEIWAIDGDRLHEEFGFALDGDIDFNLDEVPDMVVGTPGDDPTGRRGAGTVKILSGIDGSTLFKVNGRRGLETRMAVVSLDEDGKTKLRTFNRTGRRTEMSEFVLEDVNPGNLNVTILNDQQVDAQGDPHIPKPKSVQVAVTGGAGSDNSTVEVYRMAHGGLLLDSFEAFDGDTSVECGAGEINGRVNEDLVCAQADGAGGDVFVRSFERLDEGSAYFLSSEFQAFGQADTINALPIDADGGNVTVGNVTGDKQEEIIVGTTSGVPAVRIFTRDGVLIRTFLAYDPVDFSGVDVSLVDLNGSGDQLILTAPREGQAIIKVFNGDGERVTNGPEFKPINIQARPAEWTNGARVAAADVDLDDQQEILVMFSGPDGEQEVKAYEANGSQVKHWENFNPLVDGQSGGGDIAGTDRWVRR